MAVVKEGGKHRLAGTECDNCGEELYADPSHPKMEEKGEDEVLGIAVCLNCGEGYDDD